MERHPKPGSRELVKRLLRRELTCRAAKGELCLDDGIIRRTLECERVGFEEKVRFIHWLGSDIICLTPTYVGSPKQLFRPDESILAEVDLWIQKTDLFVFAILDGAFELGVRTFGFQSFLRQLQRTPSKVKMFVDRVEKNNKNAASQLAGHGIDGIIIADDKVEGLKRFKDDAKEVTAGYECGVTLSKFSDIKEGDIFESYEIEEYRE